MAQKQTLQQDDLTKIKGIAGTMQKWFIDTFEVSTFAQLAALSVDKIEKKLKSEGKIPSRTKISAWIEQAKALTALQSEWKPLASFVVEFQARNQPNQPMEKRTSVHYMETDTSMKWPGIEKDELCRWMEQQINIPEPAPEPQASKPEAQIAAAKKLTATEVRLQQPEYVTVFDVEEQERPFLGHVKHEDPISLEIDFELSEPKNGNGAATQHDYRAHCHMQNLSTGAETAWIDMVAEESEGKRPFYRAKLTDISLQPGMYNLGILVRGTNPLSTNYVKLPKLNVL